MNDPRSLAFVLLFSLALTSIGCFAGEESAKQRPVYVSVQQLLNSSEMYLDESVMVTGYLSDHCSGLCLFAYEDDAINFNVINSVQIINSATTITSIQSLCPEGYVTIVGLFEFRSGFERPGLTIVEQVRSKSLSEGTGEICWRRVQEKSITE